MKKPAKPSQPVAPLSSLAASVLLVAALANLLQAGLAARHGASWWRQVLPGRPHGIILHHSASPDTVDGRRVDVQFIDEVHARRGFGRASTRRLYHVGYHYVILRDGAIQRGRPEWMRGAHTHGHNDQIGVCLIGNFSSSANPGGAAGPPRPSSQQLAALDHLLRTLSHRYGFGPADLHRHRDYAPTACPGDRFPFAQVRQRAFGR